MFDITNKTLIKNLINQRDEDQLIIPLYIQLYNNRYSILEMDKITLRFAPSSFKVGFGTADALFMKNSFPVKRVHELDVINVFIEDDEVNHQSIRYMVFESSDVDVDDNDRLNNEIHENVSVLLEYVSKHVDEYIKNLLQQQSEEDMG